MEAPSVSARAALNCTALADTVVFNLDGRDPSRETTTSTNSVFFFVIVKAVKRPFDGWRTMRLTPFMGTDSHDM